MNIYFKYIKLHESFNNSLKFSLIKTETLNEKCQLALLYSSSFILPLLKRPCCLEHLISGWSFRTSSTTGPVSSLCPSTSPSSLLFSNKMACFKKKKTRTLTYCTWVEADFIIGKGAGTIHTVKRTTNLQENGLKLTLVATFFTIF